MRIHCVPLGLLALLCASVAALATPRDFAVSLEPRSSDDDLSGFADGNFTVCDYTVTFDTLSDLNLAIATTDLSSPITGSLQPKGTMRADCIAAYALQALINMLDTAYNNYTVINDGYDKEFDFYVTYMKKAVAYSLDNTFMFNTSAPTEGGGRISAPGPGMKCTSTLFAYKSRIRS
jgi:hypothetical protein